MEKKTFIAPSLELIKINKNEIISTSGTIGGGVVPTSSDTSQTWDSFWK